VISEDKSRFKKQLEGARAGRVEDQERLQVVKDRVGKSGLRTGGGFKSSDP